MVGKARCSSGKYLFRGQMYIDCEHRRQAASFLVKYITGLEALTRGAVEPVSRDADGDRGCEDLPPFSSIFPALTACLAFLALRSHKLCLLDTLKRINTSFLDDGCCTYWIR